MESIVSQEDMHAKLLEYVRQYSSQNDAAIALGVSAAYLSDVIRKNRPISDKVASHLGYSREIVFVPLATATA